MAECCGKGPDEDDGQNHQGSCHEGGDQGAEAEGADESTQDETDEPRLIACGWPGHPAPATIPAMPDEVHENGVETDDSHDEDGIVENKATRPADEDRDDEPDRPVDRLPNVTAEVCGGLNFEFVLHLVFTSRLKPQRKLSQIKELVNNF